MLTETQGDRKGRRGATAPASPTAGQCAAPGCPRVAEIATPFGRCCNLHYQRVLKHNAFDLPERKLSRDTVCTNCGASFDRGYAMNARRARQGQFCSDTCRKSYRSNNSRRQIGKGRFLDASGYVRVRAPAGHPLDINQSVREHRVVLFDAHGYGPYECHWCGKPLKWRTMHIDHLDDDKTNNALANLVPACPRCNMKRGQSKSVETQRRRAKQYTFRGQSKCLAEWAAELGISRAALKFRMDNGWPAEKMFTEPRGKFGPQAHG